MAQENALQNVFYGFDPEKAVGTSKHLPVLVSTSLIMTVKKNRYSHSETELPSLPVPSLESTMKKFVRSAKPLVTYEELQVTNELVKKFMAPGGIGRRLQKLLEEKAANEKNWLADWWLDTAYLGCRWPLPVWSSPGLVAPAQEFNTEDDHLAFAANVVYGALEYKTLLKNCAIPIETWAGKKLDMSQNLKILGACRIPGLNKDSLRVYSLEPNPPVHIVVSHNNQIFKQLKDCVEKSPQCGPPIGVLTTQNRHAWATVYKQLRKDKVNKESVEQIQRSIFLLSLDNPVDKPTGNQMNDGALQCLHGNGPDSNAGNRCLLADLEISCFKFGGFGKGYIKSQKISPDSFIQMAIQLAFYRMHKEPGAHYESGSTRQFIYGRTETVRSCSEESIKFANIMIAPDASNSSKVAALRDAINTHKNYVLDAMNGQGVDRHFLGLKLMAVEEGLDIPPLFMDVAYVRSTHMRLSTSQVPFRTESFLIYGPLVPDGYGCCYNPLENCIVFGTTALNSSPETHSSLFKAALEESLMDMHNVLSRETSQPKL